MDLRMYFQRMRQVENSIQETHVVVVSNDTPDGGKAGIMTEVPKLTAAKMVVEGRARLADELEAKAFREQVRAAHEECERRALASQLNLRIINGTEWGEQLKSGKKPAKD